MMMNGRYVDTAALDSREAENVQRDILAFAERWNASSLVATGITPEGRGTVVDIEALDYVIYEGVYDLVTPKDRTFISIGASVFGGCLVKLLGFEWCTVVLSSVRMTGLKHPYNGLVVPLEPIIAAHLSGNPQHECFAALFFEIFQSTHLWPLGSHFLEESSLDLDPGAFERQWGFSVPDEIRQRYLDVTAVEVDACVREIGMLAYDWAGIPDFQAIERRLSMIESNYGELYGRDWKQRLGARRWRPSV